MFRGRKRVMCMECGESFHDGFPPTTKLVKCGHRFCHLCIRDNKMNTDMPCIRCHPDGEKGYINSLLKFNELRLDTAALLSNSWTARQRLAEREREARRPTFIMPSAEIESGQTDSGQAGSGSGSSTAALQRRARARAGSGMMNQPQVDRRRTRHSLGVSGEAAAATSTDSTVASEAPIGRTRHSLGASGVAATSSGSALASEAPMESTRHSLGVSGGAATSTDFALPIAPTRRTRRSSGASGGAATSTGCALTSASTGRTRHSLGASGGAATSTGCALTSASTGRTRHSLGASGGAATSTEATLTSAPKRRTRRSLGAQLGVAAPGVNSRDAPHGGGAALGRERSVRFTSPLVISPAAAPARRRTAVRNPGPGPAAVRHRAGAASAPTRKLSGVLKPSRAWQEAAAFDISAKREVVYEEPEAMESLEVFNDEQRKKACVEFAEHHSVGGFRVREAPSWMQKMPTQTTGAIPKESGSGASSAAGAPAPAAPKKQEKLEKLKEHFAARRRSRIFSPRSWGVTSP